MSAAERVARGASLLDQKYPGWWKPGRIDTNQLDITDGANCILGQLRGDYMTGAHELRSFVVDLVDVGLYENRAISDDGAHLTDEWRAEIGRRRQAAGMLADIKRGLGEQLVPA